MTRIEEGGGKRADSPIVRYTIGERKECDKSYKPTVTRAGKYGKKISAQVQALHALGRRKPCGSKV